MRKNHSLYKHANIFFIGRYTKNWGISGSFYYLLFILWYVNMTSPHVYLCKINLFNYFSVKICGKLHKSMLLYYFADNRRMLVVVNGKLGLIKQNLCIYWLLILNFICVARGIIVSEISEKRKGGERGWSKSIFNNSVGAI